MTQSVLWSESCKPSCVVPEEYIYCDLHTIKYPTIQRKL